MVKKRNYIDHYIAPPPRDESWWEAVLAEEETRNAVYSQKNYRQDSQDGEENPDNQANCEIISTINWQKAIGLYEQDQVVTLQVSGHNRGGLLVNGEELQGFVPISHLVETPCTDSEIDAWLGKYLGRNLFLKVIECDQERGRVVFSERAALSEPGSRKHLLENLKPGDCINGTVTNITDFGVFVDLGGVEGLIHVSEISWGRVHHPTDVVKLGQEVGVYVIQIDQERARIALSLKRLSANPWETAEARYHPGQITEAVVTSVVPFGAFARLEEGLDGLIHISEMCQIENKMPPGEMLCEGQRIHVRVLHVDASRQRLGLSLNLTNDTVSQ